MKNEKTKAYGCTIGVMTRYGVKSAFVEECSPTLTQNTGDNKLSVVIAIEGNGSRPSHQGCGYSTEDTMYTLNSTEVHCVAYEENSIKGNKNED